MSTVSHQLAEWICSVRYEDIPERVLEKTRYQSLSVIASMHAGADTQAGQAVLRAATKWRKPGPCTVIPTGEQMALHEAIMVNSAFSMALDYDDYLYMGHTGHSAVLGAWAICEEERLSTKELITAQVIANEIGGRVGASAVLGPQNGQAWSFIHAVEGAALASRLYGLNVEQTAHAIAIAMYQPTFTLWPGFMGPTSKVLTAAGPTITGIQAAQFAREGLTGAPEIFEHPRKGFWKFFTFVPLPKMLTGLGKSWVSDTLAYKKYPGCAYIDTTMDALFDVLEQYHDKHDRALGAAEVKTIDVTASLLSVEMDNLSAEHVDESQPLSPVNINFSIGYNVAIGILGGAHTGAQMSQEFLDANDKEIRRLSAMTKLHHDWEMTTRVAGAFDKVLGRSSVLGQLSARELVRVARGYQSELGGRKKNSADFGALIRRHGGDLLRQVRDLPKRMSRVRERAAGSGGADLGGVDFSKFEMTFPARITIETKSGESFTARKDVPLGVSAREDYRETVEQKFRTETAAQLGETQIENALTRLRRFEDERLQELTKYFCRP